MLLHHVPCGLKADISLKLAPRHAGDVQSRENLQRFRKLKQGLLRRETVLMKAAGPDLEDPPKTKSDLRVPTKKTDSSQQVGTSSAVSKLTVKEGTNMNTKWTLPELVLDQLVDSAVDVGRHLGRQLKGLPSTSVLDNLLKGEDGKLLMRRGGTGRPVVLILGTGWAAHSCVKVIDTEMYDVVVVSPRNFFFFTPMLPSTAVGTVEFRSLLEPIRTSNEFVAYLDATCEQLDLKNKVATCSAASGYENGERPTFEVPYDILVVSVGEQPATLGVPGVDQYCYFMKEITDTVNIRNRIGKCFELASLPGTTTEDKERLLNFVVVGGGPTGVEFSGTLSDYVRGDLKRKYPQLMKYVKVTLLQSAQTILTQFKAGLAQKALENLSNTGVQVMTGVRVVEVTQSLVILKDGRKLRYGLCVWSAGNAARPLVQNLTSVIPSQAEYQMSPAPTSRKLAVDGYLRVIGAEDVIAIGDCSLRVGDPLPSTAQVAGQQGAYLAHLLNRGFVLGMGGLEQPPPFRAVMPNMFQSLLRGLQAPTSKATGDLHHDASPTNLDIITPSSSAGLPQQHLQQDGSNSLTPHHATSTDNTIVGPDSVMSSSSSNSSSLVVTVGDVDVGSSYDQQKQLAAAPGATLEYCRRPFDFLSLGIMAYVGDNKALTQLEAGSNGPVNINLYGSFAFLLWRSVYITKQVSLRNRVLILFDWLKAKVFGRDMSMF
ncbi:hypothetical protein CEUSTIGMA_g6077.t1 [Chlamydomonas eustigma]|uniref:NADH:ubiquinone reductase (non-electrogenic) n=1 Tax=Chlamydomonas eustigma TaxID=1157962 RepID=A0A250X6U9_9CHLO|nr:hypothetical protein CEUSTIGMA_g6077.t1 [Chlamydomonas eustigma]|eukprot:GAX78639.1 hypothetical protein CEUSTIGMA_g6077.t1 [Chlamydomonas eustigma]